MIEYFRLTINKVAKYMAKFTGLQELGLASLPLLSKTIWGLGRGRLIIVAARTSQGKTAFMSQLNYDLALQRYRTVFLSLEQSVEEVCMRDFCREKRIDNQQILRGGFEKYKKEWEEHAAVSSIMHAEISDCLGKSWRDINKIIDDAKEKKPDVIFIDHINDIRSDDIRNKAAIDDYLINLRALSKKYNITFVIGAQISRAGQDDKDKIPQLHHLKETGKLEEIADMVMLLHWPYFSDRRKPKNEYMVLVAKHRFGNTGYHPAAFYPEWSLIAEVEPKIVEAKNDKYKPVGTHIPSEQINWQDLGDPEERV